MPMFFKKWMMPLMDDDTGGNGGGDDIAVPETAPADVTPPSPAPQTNVPNDAPKWTPLMDYNPLLQDAPTAPVVVAPPVIAEELDFAGRKVPVVDPIIRDIHKDYSQLQRTFQESNQAVKTLQEQNQTYQNMINMYQQQQQAPTQPPTQPEAPIAYAPSPEENESFMTNLYDNPITTIDELVAKRVEAILEKKVNPYIQPIQQEHQYQAEIQGLKQKYSDFDTFIPAMQTVLQNIPQLAEKGLETVYMVARGQQPAAQAPPTAQQLLSDPAFRSQLLGDEGLRKEIIGSYMQQRSNTNQQVPPVMGNQPGGNAPAIPENRPTSIREASKLFAKSLGYVNQ